MQSQNLNSKKESSFTLSWLFPGFAPLLLCVLVFELPLVAVLFLP